MAPHLQRHAFWQWCVSSLVGSRCLDSMLFTTSSMSGEVAKNALCGSEFSPALKWNISQDGLAIEILDEETDYKVPNTITYLKSHLAGEYHIPAEWLRERCNSRQCVDVASSQPLRQPHEVGKVAIALETFTDLRISNVTNVTGADSSKETRNIGSNDGDNMSLSGETSAEADRRKQSGKVHVHFTDGTSSDYDLAGILTEIQAQRHSSLQTSKKFTFPPMHLWDAGLLQPSSFDYDEIQAQVEEGRSQKQAHLITTLLTSGIAVVMNVPRREGMCTVVGEQISTVRSTEWGTIFNVRTQPDTGARGVEMQDLAYTSNGIGFHTDNPYRDPMPDFQLLHQLEGCECKDGSYPCANCHVDNEFVDGFSVALQLKREDPEAFQLLTEIPVRWENNGGDGNSFLVANFPHIKLQETKGAPCLWAHCIEGIRFSAKSGGYSPLLPADISARFFDAKRKFSQMLSDPKNAIRINLRPGDMAIFDNRRVLHARSAIVSDVPRFLQGCYVNRDGLWYQYHRQIEQGFADGEFIDGGHIPKEMDGHCPTSGINPYISGKFKELSELTQQEVSMMGCIYKQEVDDKTADRLLALLAGQSGMMLGSRVDLREHGLQTATRAYRAGEDVDTVVMSLLHDMTETLATKNHGNAAAALLEPYLNPKVIWMLEMHEVFQGYYYFHHIGADRNARLKYKEHPHYNALVHWCEEYDQKSFNPAYPSLPMILFEGMVHEVFRRQPFWWDRSHPKHAVVTGKA